MEVILAMLSLMGGILGATLKSTWDRRAEKKRPKTEGRAVAYEDFVMFFLTSSDPPGEREPELAKISAKVLVFGETKVIKAVSAFMKEIDLTKRITADQISGLEAVVQAMRSSLLTGCGPEARSAIRELLGTLTPDRITDSDGVKKNAVMAIKG